MAPNAMPVDAGIALETTDDDTGTLVVDYVKDVDRVDPSVESLVVTYDVETSETHRFEYPRDFDGTVVPA